MEAYSVYCEACRSHIAADQYEYHRVGKRHKIEEEKAARTKILQETGLYVKGVPLGVSAAELGATFGQFGCISKIEVYGDTAYVNYSDRNSRDKALTVQHFILNKKLIVTERIIRTRDPGPCSSGMKRSFDSTKNQPQVGENVAKAVPEKSAIDDTEILTELAGLREISEQITTLKRLILAGEDNCNHIVETISNDLRNALKSAFKVCDLFCFGSMTTGLAFKTSDLDVFAHLEFNQATHLLPEATNSKKIFSKAKTCFFKRPDLFKNIVPIQHAKIPIIKIVHVKTMTACDVSFRDAIGFYNSRLLRHYLDMNEKFFDMMVFIKYWARVHGFCTSNKLSNFSLCMLGLSFFLSLKDGDGKKIVPPVQDLVKNADPSSCFHVQEWNCSFDISPITVTLPESSDFSLLGLLKSFFAYIAQLPFTTHVVSVLTGELICRKVFEEHPGDLPDAYESYKRHISEHPEAVLCKPGTCFVIHDPFKLNHNLMERVNLQTIQAFVQSCSYAASVCDIAMISSEGPLSLFSKLLNKATFTITTRSASEEVKSQGGKTVVAMKNPFAGSENLLGNVKELLCSIFEKLLLFEITPTEKDEVDSKVKVRRTNDIQDVKDENQFEIICEGQVCVWNRRKSAKQTLHISQPLNFKNEETISKYLQKLPNVNAHVKFLCEVALRNGCIYLTFTDILLTNKGRFKDLMIFMAFHLTKWTETFSADKEKLYLQAT